MSEEEVKSTSEDELLVAIVNQNSNMDVQRNLNRMARLTFDAAEAGADLIVFPENAPLLCPSEQKLDEAEPVDGTQILTCRQYAKTNDIGVLVGSFSEITDDPGRVFNTSVFIGRDGKTVAKYRKMHLFDVDVADDTAFQESETTCAGPAQPVIAEFEGWRFGMSICYDLRFPELYRAMSARGVDAFFVPSAFTYRTGSVHWELLLRARAVENLAWVIAPAQTGVCYGSRESWGHAMAVDPWGTVVAQAGHEPEVVYARLTKRSIRHSRRRIPSLDNRRM
jgi:predicted amidohydrolase